MNDEKSRIDSLCWYELNLTLEEKLAREAWMKVILDEAAAVRQAKLRVKEAREKALQEEREEIACRLLKMKTVVSSVAEITRLTKKQVIEFKRRCRIKYHITAL